MTIPPTFTPASVPDRGRRSSVWARLSGFFFLHPGLVLLLLLALPLGWLLIFYLAPLLVLVIQAFFYVDDFSGVLVREFSLRTMTELFTTPANTEIIVRSVGMSVAVTVAAALIAFPLAYFMARFASKRMRSVLYLLVLLPLWSSYLVRVYAWKLILAKEGMLTWFFNALGLNFILDGILSLPVIGGPSLSFSYVGMFLVFLYVWLPYMVLPILAALERVPKSLIEASGDLGARPSFTFRSVILPLAFPGVVAGSIFTFSLTLGDYIIPQVIGDSSRFIGTTVYQLQGTTGNLPLAAAFTLVPIVIMGIYLLVARRMGAFDAI